MNSERLQYLVDRYFDQALTGEEKAELERMLLESDAAREIFWEVARWNAALRQWGQEEWGRRDAMVAQPSVKRPVERSAMPSRSVPNRRKIVPQKQDSSHGGWWLLATAAMLMLGFFAWMKWFPSAADRSGGIAVLTHASSAVWADERLAHESGQTLSQGWLKLKSGAAQVEFSRGARVVLEGPAEFELLSDNSGALRHGKLFATIPQTAHGFTVRAGAFSAVDYGTQFGCIVPLAGAPEVHVFRGVVGLETSEKTKRELRENQAVRLANSQLQDIPASISTFLTEEKLARLDNENARGRFAKWRQFSRTFSQHPGMLAYFDFEKDGAADGVQTLTNRALNASAETNAAIFGCNWGEGRWPGKSALEFKGNNDRVRLSLTDEYRTITVLAWIRADHTPFAENTLIRAEPREQLGEMSWYIFRDGALGWSARIAPRGSGGQWRHVHSAPIFRAEGLGSWRLAATVFDGKTITHYFDGKAVGGDAVRLPSPLRLGTFDIGNASGVSPQNGSRGTVVREMVGNFFGRIDELAILSVALSAEEIQQIFEHGVPGEN